MNSNECLKSKLPSNLAVLRVFSRLGLSRLRSKYSTILKTMTALCLVSFSLTVAAQPAEGSIKLTESQKTAAHNLVNRYTQSCINGTQAPADAGEISRALFQWTRDPELCACNAKSLRNALTPAVLSGGEKVLLDFFQQWAITGQAVCLVPFIKFKMKEQCPQIMLKDFLSSGNREEIESKLQTKGFNSVEDLTETACTCINEETSKIDTPSWIKMSLEGYNDYVDSKRTGKPYTPKPNQLSSGIESCLKKVL
jgi:hypothetical protein